MSSTAEITRTEWARLGTRSVGLTAPAPEVFGCFVISSCGLAVVPLQAFLASDAGPVSPTEQRGGRTGVSRGFDCAVRRCDERTRFLFAKRDDDGSSERDVRERSTIKWWDVSKH